jgi:hypothetical protein
MAQVLPYIRHISNKVGTIMRKILLAIENDKVRAEIIRNVFGSLGYSIIEVAEEEEVGVSMIKEKTYDLILVSPGLLEDRVKFYDRIWAFNRDVAERVMFL